MYVGDSLMKDVAMAKDAGVLDIHAAYGEAQRRPEYELLRRVSHWPDSTVAQEQLLIGNPLIEPTISLREGFYEILPFLGLGEIA